MKLEFIKQEISFASMIFKNVTNTHILRTLKKSKIKKLKLGISISFSRKIPHCTAVLNDHAFFFMCGPSFPVRFALTSGI